VGGWRAQHDEELLVLLAKYNKNDEMVGNGQDM
jgi:hypothetical protein